MQLTLQEVIALIRDICFVGALLFGVFKLGLWLKPAIDFFSEAKVFMGEVRQHMASVESNLNLLLTNHLPHLQQEIEKLSRLSERSEKRDIGE